MFVRSDSATYLTAAGQEAMCAYGIKTVVDLRSPGELAGAEDPRFPRLVSGIPKAAGVTYVHRALVDDAVLDNLPKAKDMLERYLLIVDHRRQAFRDIFVSLSQAEGPVLFHCMAGKDRTGLVAAMLLDLAGVPREHIAEDFAETDSRLAAMYEKWIALAPAEAQRAMRDELRCPPERIIAVLDHLDRGWGGVAGYLEASGVDSATIDRLASILA